VIFLVGDAPPHTDYPNDVPYQQTLAIATQKGIAVNTIQCGHNPATTPAWERIAQLGQGRYFQVEQAGSAVAISTPYDEQLAEFSARLDETRLYYGSAEEKAKQERKLAATDKLHAGASLASRARRAVFNASSSGKDNFLGEGELVEDLTQGRVTLDAIDATQLPAPLQTLSPKEQRTLVEEKAKQRNELQDQIEDLAKQRSDYLKQKLAEMGGAEDSLDQQIYRAVREQADGKGLHYQTEAAAY
jgi:hypothetical protein